MTGRTRQILTYLVLGLWSFVCLFPLYWIAATTLKQPLDVINGPRYLPFVDFKPTLDAWSYILFNPDDDTLRRYMNSVVVASGHPSRSPRPKEPPKRPAVLRAVTAYLAIFSHSFWAAAELVSTMYVLPSLPVIIILQ